jgi:hypothetical protein
MMERVLVLDSRDKGLTEHQLKVPVLAEVAVELGLHLLQKMVVLEKFGTEIITAVAVEQVLVEARVQVELAA